MRKTFLSIAILGLLGIVAAAQQRAEKSNMELAGYNDLQARSAYQPGIARTAAGLDRTRSH